MTPPEKPSTFKDWMNGKTPSANTPAEFWESFCRVTGTMAHVCGGDGMTWPSVLELLLFREYLSEKGRERRASSSPSPTSDESGWLLQYVVDQGFCCTRCAHEWVPRDIGDPPRVCPSCKSPYWDVERKHPKPSARKTRTPRGH